MTSRRLQRVNEQLKREISRILRREVHDPRVGLVLVTDVDTSGDFSVASVYVRPTGEDKDWNAMMKGLEAAAPFVRRELGQDLKLRKIPELHFHEDHTLEQAMRIEELLAEVLPEESENQAGSDAPEGAGPLDGTEDSGAPAEWEGAPEPEDSEESVESGRSKRSERPGESSESQEGPS